MNQDNEKLYIYLAVAVIAIAFIFVLVLIWKPSNDDLLESINYIGDAEEYKEVQTNNYKSVLEGLLQVNNYDQLFEKVDKKWLEDNSYTKESLYNFLIENGIISNNVPLIKDTTIVNGQDSTYYRFQIQNEKGNLRYVLINESQSNDYTISFEQKGVASIEGKEYKDVIDGVTYTLKTKAALENLIQYELTIESTREDTITFDLSAVTNVFLMLKTGESIMPIDITSREVNIYEVQNGGKISVDLTFNLSLEKISNIEKMQLFHVYDRDGEKMIEIDMLGGEN